MKGYEIIETFLPVLDAEKFSKYVRLSFQGDILVCNPKINEWVLSDGAVINNLFETLKEKLRLRTTLLPTIQFSAEDYGRGFHYAEQVFWIMQRVFDVLLEFRFNDFSANTSLRRKFVTWLIDYIAERNKCTADLSSALSKLEQGNLKRIDLATELNASAYQRLVAVHLLVPFIQLEKD